MVEGPSLGSRDIGDPVGWDSVGGCYDGVVVVDNNERPPIPSYDWTGPVKPRAIRVHASLERPPGRAEVPVEGSFLGGRVDDAVDGFSEPPFNREVAVPVLRGRVVHFVGGVLGPFARERWARVVAVGQGSVRGVGYLLAGGPLVHGLLDDVVGRVFGGVCVEVVVVEFGVGVRRGPFDWVGHKQGAAYLRVEAEQALGVLHPAGLEASALRVLSVCHHRLECSSKLLVPPGVVPLRREKFEDGLEVALGVVERRVGNVEVSPPPPSDRGLHCPACHHRGVDG